MQRYSFCLDPDPKRAIASNAIWVLDVTISGDMAETFEQRLRRYADRPATDTLGWLITMLHNYHVIELRRAREQKLYYCVYLLAHSIIQTVSETMFGKAALLGTSFFWNILPMAPVRTEDSRESLRKSTMCGTSLLIVVTLRLSTRSNTSSMTSLRVGEGKQMARLQSIPPCTAST
jgi:hypothetical protein